MMRGRVVQGALHTGLHVLKRSELVCTFNIVQFWCALPRSIAVMLLACCLQARFKGSGVW